MPADSNDRTNSGIRIPKWIGYAVTVVLEVALTAGLGALTSVFPLGKFPIPYVLLTMLIAYVFGQGPAIVSVVLGWFAFTYLVAPPRAVHWPPAQSPQEWAGQVALLLGVIVVSIAMVQARRSRRRIEERSARLEAEIRERERAEEEIRELNAELDQRVVQRTAELENANKELEAFSYSVSHDLRAPLRAVDGFSDALLKHYRDSLDARGQDYLRRVRAAAQRMAQLIDDILGLSRAARAEMHRQSVDMSAMASGILGALQKSQPKRKAKIIIAPGLVIDADDHLIRIALDNLLGNAWKFTEKRDIARIELGSLEQNDERVYFVRDNGAGFNPAYAEKLFSAFQRLHSEAEFTGTGIGLALVQRIVRRHGGRIWAESEVDKGATFYFTVGEAGG